MAELPTDTATAPTRTQEEAAEAPVEQDGRRHCRSALLMLVNDGAVDGTRDRWLMKYVNDAPQI